MTKKKAKQLNTSWLILVLALIVLMASVVFWSIIGANNQLINASQSITSLLMSNHSLFSHALIPSNQTFLIKWPIYFIINLFDTSKLALVVSTVLIDLVTTGLFVLLLSKIEKRPKYLAVIVLAFSSILMLIPPTVGSSINSVNMAMLASRNLEYIVFIYALILLLRSPKFKSPQFWYSLALMSVVVASDKFFFVISALGAVVALIYYGLIDKEVTDNIVTKWLSVTVGGLVGSAILLGLISKAKITHFNSQFLGNYHLVTNFHDVFRGIFYSLTSLLTNFGANPASTTTAIHLVPKNFFINYFSLGIIGYSVNLITLLVGVFIVFKVTRHNLTIKKRGKQNPLNIYSKVATLLYWTSLAAVIVFIFSAHNYSADSNYLFIILLAVFISIAIYSKGINLSDRSINIILLVLLIGVISGSAPAWTNYRHTRASQSTISKDNQSIIEALKQHPISVLVGSYNQVVPIKQDDPLLKSILPLNSCSLETQTLSSSLWQPNLKSTSFAYILNLSSKNTGYQVCNLAQIKATYGSPNSSVLIRGNISSPKVLLLFFDHGLNLKKRITDTSYVPVVTTAPIPFTTLPSVTCNVPTLMTVVAHQDDDLLFMNPDLSKKIKQGDCVRAIYLTAGDDGKGSFYWLGRQLGSEAAYSKMLGTNPVWLERNIELAPNEYIVMDSPAGNPNITLIFLHLPDGNLTGQGFPNSNFESLASLYSGKESAIQSVDSQSSYTSTGLVAALTTLMHYYQPSEIWTQSSFFVNGDHSDHLTIGKFVTRAYNDYESQQYQNLVTIPIIYFVGYPIRTMPVNVSSSDQAFKTQVFTSYARNDSNICNDKGCFGFSGYTAYIQREYTEPY